MLNIYVSNKIKNWLYTDSPNTLYDISEVTKNLCVIYIYS